MSKKLSIDVVDGIQLFIKIHGFKYPEKIMEQLDFLKKTILKIKEAQ